MLAVYFARAGGFMLAEYFAKSNFMLAKSLPERGSLC